MAKKATTKSRGTRRAIFEFNPNSPGEPPDYRLAHDEDELEEYLTALAREDDPEARGHILEAIRFSCDGLGVDFPESLQAMAREANREQRLARRQSFAWGEVADVDSDSIVEENRQRSDRTETIFPIGNEYVDTLMATLDMIQRTLRVKAQRLLDDISGKEYETLELKKEVVEKINRLLNAAEARIECPNCGEPAIMRAIMTGNSKSGVFRFGHTKTKKVHGAKVRFPEGLRLFKD